ncbi:aldehyde dehydrogenase [Leptodontidium sp. 2 PMI_412]|nr:aldehyde dehydrogenase [Leptodontidium sp. 2 PMI_412]
MAGAVDLKKIETRLFINGEFVESSNGKTFDLISPKTLEVVAKVHEASEQDADRAVAAAKAAQPAWAALSIEERSKPFKKLAALVREHNAELAELEALSMGVPVSTYFHAHAFASTFDYYSEAGYNNQGNSSLNTPGFVNLTFRQPFGVVAAIIPWNIPLLFFAAKCAPALITGNTVVLKSSEKAPLTSARVASFLNEAGFPPGVLNIITGFGNVSGSVLSHHMDVRALSFTGSTRTGRYIQEAAAKSNLKVVLLELGGKSPAIIFDDADLDKAAEATKHSVQNNSGQTCMANSRVYVQDTVADKFIELFKAKFASVSLGDPTASDTNHGPQADQVQHSNVLKYLEIIKKDGKVILGGQANEEKGYFINPTIVTGLPEDSQAMKEEIFGPVVNINVFKTEEEVLAKANNTEYGLYASVFTKNIDRAMRFAKGLEAGTVGVNCTSPLVAKDTPFGGYKGSGIGREGIFHSMDNFLETKSILRHFLPQDELNLETLRSIAKDLSTGNSPIQDAAKSISAKDSSEPADGSVSNESTSDTEEIGDLHHQLGCLMKDSLGEYRYLGAYSDIAFNAAVCSIAEAPSPEQEESKIILPPKDPYPPQKPSRVKLLREPVSPSNPYLPPRQYCDYYVSRYFEEVHCIYWLYPIEQFHARLDDTYMRGGGAATSSWLCSLYAIFALGAASGENSKSILYADFVSEEARMNPDLKTSDDYLALAKALIPAVHDEADIDSIRALAILSLALLTFRFRITSYLYMGTSMQIAFSLGLQHDQSPTTQSPMSRQQNRRIWWTLYILDQEIASRCGSPCVSDERSVRIQTPLPSEQVLNPGTNTPLGSLSVSTSLCRLKREIIQTIYPERSSDSRTISFQKVTNYVSSLQKWQASMPSHLKWGVPVAPTHRRSIGILHLNYWNAMMLLTQPFLLYSVIRGSSLNDIRKAWFDKLGEICVDAAKNAIIVLKSMENDRSLSSLMTFDCTCTLKVIMILSLALAKRESAELRAEYEFCIGLIDRMEQIGFCKSVNEELPSHLARLNVKKERRESDASMKVSPNAVSQMWSGFDP